VGLTRRCSGLASLAAELHSLGLAGNPYTEYLRSAFVQGSSIAAVPSVCPGRSRPRSRAPHHGPHGAAAPRHSSGLYRLCINVETSASNEPQEPIVRVRVSGAFLQSAAVRHRPAWQWQQAETRGSSDRTTPAFPAKSRGGPHPGTSITSGVPSEPPLSVHPHPTLSTERSH